MIFYKKYEQKIKLLTDKFMPPRDEDEHLRMQKRKEMEQYADYRNYLSFSMYEQVTDENGRVIRENFVDDMAGRDSGGEGQNPKYVALLAGFAMLYMQQSNRDSKIKLVLLDEAFFQDGSGAKCGVSQVCKEDGLAADCLCTG